MNLSKETLTLYLDDCKRAGNTETAMLIECILESYKQSDSERAQKIAAVRASSDILAESRRKDVRITELLKTIEDQNITVASTTAAFRKMYEVSVFGNKFFKIDPILRLWVSVEKFCSSSSDSEFKENNIEMLTALSDLSQDTYLQDMRNNMINFRKYMESNNGSEDEEGSTDTTGDNA